MAAERRDPNETGEPDGDRVEYLDQVTRGEVDPAEDDTATHAESVQELMDRLSS